MPNWHVPNAHGSTTHARDQHISLGHTCQPGMPHRVWLLVWATLYLWSPKSKVGTSCAACVAKRDAWNVVSVSVLRMCTTWRFPAPDWLVQRRSTGRSFGVESVWANKIQPKSLLKFGAGQGRVGSSTKPTNWARSIWIVPCCPDQQEQPGNTTPIQKKTNGTEQIERNRTWNSGSREGRTNTTYHKSQPDSQH